MNKYDTYMKICDVQLINIIWVYLFPFTLAYSFAHLYNSYFIYKTTYPVVEAKWKFSVQQIQFFVCAADKEQFMCGNRCEKYGNLQL
jgi:hypothetical protein